MRLLPLLVLFVSATASALPRIAILEVRPLDPSLAQTAHVVEQVLTTETVKTRRFEAMGRDEISSLLGFEKQKALLGCSDTSCLAEIGGALGAQHLVSASVGKLGKLTHLDVKIIDSRRARVVAADAVDVDSEEKLPEAVRALLLPMLDRVAPPPAPGQPATAAQASPAPEVAKPAAEPKKPRLVPWVLVGTGAVAIAASAGLFVNGLSFNDTNITDVPFPEAAKLRDRAVVKLNAGSAIGAAGAGMALAGVVLLTLGEPSSLAVLPGPRGVALAGVLP